MATSSFGGNSWDIQYANSYVYSRYVPIPKGRIMANGKGPIQIHQLRGYASGRGTARYGTMRLTNIAGQIFKDSTDTFRIESNSRAQDTGFRGVTNIFVTDGGTGTFWLNFNGSFYFGRSPWWWYHDYEHDDEETWDDTNEDYHGILGGSLNHHEGPTTPGPPTVTPVSNGSVYLTWSAPSSNGGTPILGYRIFYSTNQSTWSYVDVGAVTEASLSGLQAGVTYYFRVAAKNGVTNWAGTTSQWSATGSTRILAGGKIAISGAWRNAAWRVAQRGVWKNATIRTAQGGEWKLVV